MEDDEFCESYEYCGSEEEEDDARDEANHVVMGTLDQDIADVNKFGAGLRAWRSDVCSGVNTMHVHVGVTLARLGIVTEDLACALGLPAGDWDAAVTVRLTLRGIVDATASDGVEVTLDDAEHMWVVLSDDARRRVPLATRWWLARRLKAVLTDSKSILSVPDAKRDLSVAGFASPRHIVQELVSMTGETESEADAVLRRCDWNVHEAYAVVAGLGLGLGRAALRCATPDLPPDSSAADLPQWLRTPALLEPLVPGSQPPWELHIATWSFLMRTAHAVEQAMRECNRCCLQCDGPLTFVALKPSVCAAPLCQARHCLYGFGTDVYRELTGNRAVAELYISLLYAAAHMEGRVGLCFPREVVGRGSVHAGSMPDDTFQTADGHDNVELLRRVVGMLPATDDILAATVAETRRPDSPVWGQEPGEPALRCALTRIHGLLYPLLLWVFTSSTAVLREVPPQDIMPQLSKFKQFVIQCGPTETARNFRDMKLIHGAKWAFHGSPLYNWHSIVRLGLRVMSKTKYMTTGAAYGDGIYMAGRLALSLQYSAKSSAALITPWPYSPYGNTILALCEYVANGDMVKEHNVSHDPYYVAADEGHVAVRVLLVRPRKDCKLKPATAGAADTTDDESTVVTFGKNAILPAVESAVV